MGGEKIVIFSCRPFLSLISEKNNNLISHILRRSPSYKDIKIITWNYLINQEALTKITKDRILDSLQHLGGIAGITTVLKVHPEKGISDDIEDLHLRRQAFGSNSYKKQPIKGFFSFAIEVLKDHIIIILLVCAALSLPFGIGLKEGWYDGGSIFLAVFLVVAATAVRNFRQVRQFANLNTERSNIQVEVQIYTDARRRQILQSFGWPELSGRLCSDGQGTPLHVLLISSLCATRCVCVHECAHMCVTERVRSKQILYKSLKQYLETYQKQFNFIFGISTNRLDLFGKDREPAGFNQTQF